MSTISGRTAGEAEQNDVLQELTQDSFHVDIEQKAVEDAHLQNKTVQAFTWQGISVTVKDRKTKKPKVILSNVNGIVKAGS